MNPTISRMRRVAVTAATMAAITIVSVGGLMTAASHQAGA